MACNVVTGGAGFIGSCLVAGLERSGGEPTVVFDELGRGSKWRNLAKRELEALLPPEALLPWLEEHASKVGRVFHLGAVSATTETDVDLILSQNFHLSTRLWEFCAARGIPFFYASSAATYGDGSQGFDDDWSPEALARLRPLNPYGWSKHLFDRWVSRRISEGRPAPPSWAGLKFFNVYGPGENHKGEMRSVVSKVFDALRDGRPVRLFRSHDPRYPDGGQCRDFVWVGDCVEVLLWLAAQPDRRGIFNVGTGRARSFLDFVKPVFEVLGRRLEIEFIDTPEGIREKYQYFTQAEIGRLRKAGYERPFLDVEEGVRRYVEEYLAAGDPHP